MARLKKKPAPKKHDDAKMDKAVIKKMVKKEALTGVKKGGRCAK